jgi:hypothetical protein
MGRHELAKHVQPFYSESLKPLVETEQNIGKMIIIKVESGDYEIDKLGIEVVVVWVSQGNKSSVSRK